LFPQTPAYLSEAPQAEPQAAGFSSGLSDAPHALPQAAGFSSGLSDAPHAVPHAALACLFSSSFHPAMFVNAISLTSCCQNPFDRLSPGTHRAFALLHDYHSKDKPFKKVRTFLLPGYKKVTSFWPLV
jgi:hypothetical protein